MAAGIFFNGFSEIGIPEVGPVFWADDNFRVRNLPEQKIGDAKFTGGSNEKVRVRELRGVKVFGKKLVINISWVDLAGCRFYCDGARRICDFLTRPIGEREDEIESGVF